MLESLHYSLFDVRHSILKRNNEYRMLNEEHRRIYSLNQNSVFLRLNGSDHHGIENISYRAATTQVIDRFVEALQHRTDRQSACLPLHGFVGVVAGVQVGKDQYAGLAGDFGVWHFLFPNLRIHCCVVLDRSLHLQLGISGSHQFRGQSDLLHVFTCSRRTGGVG